MWLHFCPQIWVIHFHQSYLFTAFVKRRFHLPSQELLLWTFTYFFRLLVFLPTLFPVLKYVISFDVSKSDRRMDVGDVNKKKPLHWQCFNAQWHTDSKKKYCRIFSCSMRKLNSETAQKLNVRFERIVGIFTVIGVISALVLRPQMKRKPNELKGPLTIFF